MGQAKHKLRHVRSSAETEQDLNQHKWNLGHIVTLIANAHREKQNLLKRIPELEFDLNYAKEQESKKAAEKVEAPVETPELAVANG